MVEQKWGEEKNIKLEASECLSWGKDDVQEQ